MVGLFIGSLTAYIFMVPITDAVGSSIIPSIRAPLLVDPLALPPAASISMNVDYDSPLTDPPSESDKNDVFSCYKDLNVPVSM